MKRIYPEICSFESLLSQLCCIRKFNIIKIFKNPVSIFARKIYCKNIFKTDEV